MKNPDYVYARNHGDEHWSLCRQHFSKDFDETKEVNWRSVPVLDIVVALEETLEDQNFHSATGLYESLFALMKGVHMPIGQIREIFIKILDRDGLI